jgi:hypothetical protein
MKMLLLAALPLVTIAHRATAQADMYNGRPAFAEGTELGYYVWRDGEHWHLRWTTMGRTRSFTGSVVSEGGDLHSLKRIDVESETRVLYPGRAPRVWVGPRGRTHVGPGRAPVVVKRDQDKIEKDGDNRIVFATRTTGDIDGFDFRVDDKVNVLRLVLDIDGRPVPNLVEAGSANQKPRALPLIVRLK